MIRKTVYVVYGCILVCGWLLATPLVGTLLAFHPDHLVEALPEGETVGAVVSVDSPDRAGEIAAARLFKAGKAACVVDVSRRESSRAMLIDLGVPEGKIVSGKDLRAALPKDCRRVAVVGDVDEMACMASELEGSGVEAILIGKVVERGYSLLPRLDAFANNARLIRLRVAGRED